MIAVMVRTSYEPGICTGVGTSCELGNIAALFLLGSLMDCAHAVLSREALDLQRDYWKFYCFRVS